MKSLAHTRSLAAAYGISADGSTVVGISTRAGFSEEGFRWTSADGMVRLDPPATGTHTFPLGASGDGSVIVGTRAFQAFRWTADSSLVGLGIVPGGFQSHAEDVSADGSVIVGRSFPAAGGAFRWTASDGYESPRCMN